ncbi:MAG: plasmid pRiA4b ORF-3 family protein [Gemmatimonadaceae bacterium]
MTKKKTSARKRSVVRRAHPALIHQFLIVLSNTNPLVWRRIQVPADYTFWDLHVAIQDAIGWLDYHLHQFTVVNEDKGVAVRIGIPDEDFPDERPCLPGCEVLVSDYVRDGSPPALYLYDFGDAWNHAVLFEGWFHRDPSLRYPRCVGGANARPPEDCGGPHGFEEFKRAIADPEHPEHDEYLEWVGGSYDVEAFDPTTVRFDDPRERWRVAFQ